MELNINMVVWKLSRMRLIEVLVSCKRLTKNEGLSLAVDLGLISVIDKMYLEDFEVPNCG